MLLVIHEPALLLQYAFIVFDPTILTFMVYSLSYLDITFLVMILYQQLRFDLPPASSASYLGHPVLER